MESTEKNIGVQMSWRLLFAVLLLAAGVSAWGGLRLGDWLIAHGPVQPLPPITPPELTDTPTLGADGKPFVASAPQPLSNGRLGVPEQKPPVDWQIANNSLMDEPSQISLATTSITLEQAVAIAAGDEYGNDMDNIAQLTAGSHDKIQPIEVPEIDSAPATATGSSWQNEFNAALKACENVGFFSRPSCAWAARNKYCEPNKAWGKVDGCPAKNY